MLLRLGVKGLTQANQKCDCISVNLCSSNAIVVVHATNLQNGDAVAVANYLQSLQVMSGRLCLDVQPCVVGARQADVRFLSEAALRQRHKKVRPLQRLSRRVVAHAIGSKHVFGVITHSLTK